MTNDPEIKARILEWQRKYHIRDDDPAMALIELLTIYGVDGRSTGETAAPAVAPEEVKALAATSERTGRLLEEIKEVLHQKPEQVEPDHETREILLLSEKSNLQLSELKEIIGKLQSQSLSEQDVKGILSSSERTSFLLAELKEIIGKVQLKELAEQFQTYHEGIDFATQKMALIIKEGDDLLARLGKVAAQINPIARGAVVVLMLFSGVVGWLIAKLF